MLWTGEKSMRKSIIISDSFKGSLSSQEICEIAAQSFRRFYPDCTLITIPVADGGEGTVACFQGACGGTEVTIPVQGPYGETVQAAYLQLEGHQAVIEMASSAGLPLVGDHKNPCETSTYGVGQQIRHAVEHGNTRILLGLGGSCTNDGGCGCAAALGVRFLDAGNHSFIPVGKNLDRIAKIDLEQAEHLLDGVQITAMCDIDNPLHGPTGAAYVFGPQKGADAAAAAFLDTQLLALDHIIQKELRLSVADYPGAGAAGGFGAGMMAFLHASLKPGIEAVLELVNFDALLEDCDLVITGEGRMDSQSIRGKVISGVGGHAYRHGVPVIAVVGEVSREIESICDVPEAGIRAVFSINRQALPFSESKNYSRENYQYTIDNILRLFKISERSL